MNESKLIDDLGLETVVLRVIESYISSGLKLEVTRTHLESTLYDDALSILQTTKSFYKGLSNKKLLDMLKVHVDFQGYIFKEEKIVNISDEYDELMLKKANGLDYDTKRAQSLKSRLGF